MATTESKTKREQAEGREWKCAECGKTFTSSSGLGGHIAQSHGKSNRPNTTGPQRKLPYSELPNGEGFRCDVEGCGKVMAHASSIRSHLKDVHKLTAGRDKKAEAGVVGAKRVGKTDCPECGEQVDNRALSRHMEKHGRDKQVIELDPDIQAMIAPLEDKLAILRDAKAELSLKQGELDGQIDQLMKMLRVAAPAKYLPPSQLPKGQQQDNGGRSVSQWRIDDTAKWMAEEFAKGREHFTIAEAVTNFGWKRPTVENVFHVLRSAGIIRLVGQADGGGRLYAFNPANADTQLEVSASVDSSA